MPADRSFRGRLLEWFERYGRHALPWQQDPDPYRIWISEIMLQQTQVKTVVGYFGRFLARFPDVTALARAELDEVLHHWSGLGYYARARNLHRAARIIDGEHGGVLPGDLDGLTALPGIGRSTAGAILALSAGQRHPILDGNVKRVLCRFHGVEGWPGTAAVNRRLWELADRHTPHERVAEYTQAIMDLGATVCVRRRPVCRACPVATDCRARLEGRPTELPTSRKRKPLPIRRVLFIVARDAGGRIYLERRAASGIWGGLWSLPECPMGTDVADWCERRLGRTPTAVNRLPAGRHTFTHFRLEFEPVLVEVGAPPARVMEAREAVWYNGASSPGLGMATPVSALLARLAGFPEGDG